MPLEGLTIIGESINDSVPSTKKLFDANDIPGILNLAKTQDEGGAAYIDVNVGPRSPEFMAEMVAKIQQVTAKPLSIDTPDPAIAKAGLEAYNLDRAGGKKPVINSISARAPPCSNCTASSRSGQSSWFRNAWKMGNRGHATRPSRRSRRLRPCWPPPIRRASPPAIASSTRASPPSAAIRKGT